MAIHSRHTYLGQPAVPTFIRSIQVILSQLLTHEHALHTANPLYSCVPPIYPLRFCFFPRTPSPPPPSTNCTVCAPNPIASTYPNNITGTFNATTSTIIVPLSYAQSLLPPRLASLILPHAYTRFSIPPTHYPLVVENAVEHDIRVQGANVVPDFSSLRLTFPFIDHLNDGYSCFRYISYIYLSELAPIAIQGYGAYNVSIERAVFDPPDAPFRRLDASRSGRNQLVGFDVYAPNETEPPPFQSPPLASVRTRDHHQAKKGHHGSHSFPPHLLQKRNQPALVRQKRECMRQHETILEYKSEQRKK